MNKFTTTTNYQGVKIIFHKQKRGSAMKRKLLTSVLVLITIFILNYLDARRHHAHAQEDDMVTTLQKNSDRLRQLNEETIQNYNNFNSANDNGSTYSPGDMTGNSDMGGYNNQLNTPPAYQPNPMPQQPIPINPVIPAYKPPHYGYHTPVHPYQPDNYYYEKHWK